MVLAPLEDYFPASVPEGCGVDQVLKKVLLLPGDPEVALAVSVIEGSVCPL